FNTLPFRVFWFDRLAGELSSSGDARGRRLVRLTSISAAILLIADIFRSSVHAKTSVGWRSTQQCLGVM
ncbi:MAG: hypothetical protein WDN30_12490, partial [Pararobbsia sp.]